MMKPEDDIPITPFQPFALTEHQRAHWEQQLIYAETAVRIAKLVLGYGTENDAYAPPEQETLPFIDT